MSTEKVPGTPVAAPSFDFEGVSDVVGGLTAVALANIAIMLTTPPPPLPNRSQGFATVGLDGDGFPIAFPLRAQLPVAGVSAEQFYAPLLEVSGQSIPSISQVYDAVADYTTHLDDHSTEVQQAVNTLFTAWTGEAKEACSAYAAKYVEFVNSQRDMCTKLCEVYVGFTGAIQAARENTAKNVGQFIKSINALIWPTDDGSNENLALTLLAAVVGGVISIATAGTAAPAVGALLTLATSAIATGAGKLISDSYKQATTFGDCVSAYFKTAKQIHDDLADALGKLAGELDFITSNAPVAPKTPINSSSVDDSHHPLEPVG